jgi:hypothetical protein
VLSRNSLWRTENLTNIFSQVSPSPGQDSNAWSQSSGNHSMRRSGLLYIELVSKLIAACNFFLNVSSRRQIVALYIILFQGWLRRTFDIIRCFGKYSTCYLQGEHLLIGRFWNPYTGQAIDGECDMMDLTGEAETQETPNQYILTVQMATALFAESRSCTLNSSRGNLRTRNNGSIYKLSYVAT